MNLKFNGGGVTYSKNLELSIIIPVYNVEKYLEKCLSSVLEIRDINYEVLIVNDGSSDNSQKIIDEYCKKDSKVRSFAKENGGISSARNYGLERAQGEYIWFVDSDDFIDENRFKEFFNYSKKDKLDIYFGSYIEFKDGELPQSLKQELKECDKFDVWFYEFQKKLQTVWRGIYKLSFLKKEEIYFNEELSLGEDLLFNQLAISKTSKIKYVNIPFYMYRTNRKGSAMNSSYQKKLKEHYKIAKILSKEIANKDLPKIVKKFPIKFYLDFLSRTRERDLKVEKSLWKIKGIFFYKLKIRFKIWKKTYLQKRYKIVY